MSKRRGRSRRRTSSGPPRRAGRNDGAIYFVTIAIGLTLIGLGMLATGDPGSWRYTFVGALGVVLALANVSAVQAYLGRPLPTWRGAFARLVLRSAGYGGRNGRPIEAAHDADAARIAIMISLAISLVGFAVAVLVLIA